MTPVPASPNPKSKPTTANPSNGKLKSSKENAPSTPASNPNSITSSFAGKMKSTLPPRPPLKRKISIEYVASENCAAVVNSSDSGVKVIVRVRPPNKDEEDGGNAIQKITEDSLTISGQAFTPDSLTVVHSKQIDIFELGGHHLLRIVLWGLIAPSLHTDKRGKTYTIWGASNGMLNEDQQGLAPRIFRRLFERIDEEQVKQADRQLEYTCRCSFLEIYNEQITDLLDPSQKNLRIREDVKTGVYVENLREDRVTSIKFNMASIIDMPADVILIIGEKLPVDLCARYRTINKEWHGALEPIVSPERAERGREVIADLMHDDETYLGAFGRLLMENTSIVRFYADRMALEELTDNRNIMHERRNIFARYTKIQYGDHELIM